MLNIGHLAEVVQHNCDISDALYAGNYTMCIFLLKMREYYRWEKQIPLSANLVKEDVGNWMVDRENIWGNIEDEQYLPVPLSSSLCDPFDTDAINAELIPQGYVYSSGFGVFNKPHFFLGELQQVDQHDDITVYSSSCEYARDLVAPAAMTLNKNIFIRHEPLRRVIWEKIEEWRWKRDESVPLARVLNGFSAQESDEMILDHLCAVESSNVVLHELGETEAGKILGPAWEEMIYSLPRSEVELNIRAVRDHLADCLVLLPDLLKNNNHNSIHFYFANFTGVRRVIFPSLLAAYQQWVTDGDVEKLHNEVNRGRIHWRSTALSILDAFKAQSDAFGAKVAQLVEPKYLG